MTLVYILLGVIAIGVLLASEAGQKLLFWIAAVLVLVGLGYLVFWLIVFIVNSEMAHQTFGYILGVFIIGIIWMIFSSLLAKISKFIKEKYKNRKNNNNEK